MLALLQDLIGCQSSLHLKNTLKSQSAAAGRDAAVPGEFGSAGGRNFNSASASTSQCSRIANRLTSSSSLLRDSDRL